MVSENVANLLASNRPKARLEKLARKVAEVVLSEDKLFQELLQEETE